MLLVAPGAITSGFGKKQLNSFHQPDGKVFFFFYFHPFFHFSLLILSPSGLPTRYLLDVELTPFFF